MTKKEKITYINEVNDRFMNAKNHGNSNNWWYPLENRIAYNVKMSAFADVDTLEDYLTKRQNDFYSKETLYQLLQDKQDTDGEMLVLDIKEQYKLDAVFAGRSGGWIEVDYENGLIELDENGDTIYESDVDINMYYKEAKALEKLEIDVADFIEKSHAEYEKYINSKEYYRDISEMLLDDQEIAETYRNDIKRLANKLE